MPAPTRYVVDRPDTPDTNPADGTYFSPWIQPDNQTADAVGVFATTPGVAGGVALGGETTVEDPPAPEEPPGEIPQFATQLANHGDAGALNITDEFTLLHTTWNLKSGNPSGTDDDAFYLSHTLEGTRGATGEAISANPQQLAWTDAWRPAEWPVAAIGYEVEQAEVSPGIWAPLANPISAAFTIGLAPSTYFGTVLGGLFSVATVNTQWGSDATFFPRAFPLTGLGLQIAQGAPRTIASADDAHYGAVAVQVPTSGAMDPAYDTITVPDLSAAPPHTGLVGFHSQVGKHPDAAIAEPSVVLEDGVRLEVSANASITGVYTIRPPRIRWIYDRVPYRRITQRGDSLAGGARRVGARSKTIQGSNRRGTGSIV